MKCIYHNDREAEFVCASCGQPVCKECVTAMNGKNVCKACAYKSMQYVNQQYNRTETDGINGFLYFIYLAIPGLRHMYLGLMKRGLGFLIAFFISIGVAALIEDLAAIIVPAIFIVWFYSAFDSYQCRKLMAKGVKVEDKDLFQGYGLGNIKDFINKRRALSGTVVLLTGIYLFFRQTIRYGWSHEVLPNFVLDTMGYASDSIVPILLIIAGIYLLSRVGHKNTSKEE